MPALAHINVLSWDSYFFGRPLGRLRFDATANALTQSVLNVFALVQAKVATQDEAQIKALRAIGFESVEGEIDCCYILPPLKSTEDRIALPTAEIRPATLLDIPVLRALAADALVLSRIRPPWFSNNERRRFYAQWVENAVRGTFDDLCLLFEGHRGIEGLVTLRQIGQYEARIGLLAVAPALRGRGTGRQLYLAAVAWCYQRNLRSLWMATQSANLLALQFYLSNGAIVAYSSFWLYRENNDPI
ncbi:dTDP-4-amino-4,6-dideoxy-D-galactose acyltransferase [Candidatus Palibaumannia cicadellinicola]|uniref:Lipopolysaccharide biosynthesis protein RffC n=1 Tax=Candidatus Palibaumannia cicadellinicola TaxID=186490 RepID=A0A088MY04_9GAMM|nr:dTDP-4-amino-4,6-dideoxy-D-galactose acyltransferase [Candidatus Baumannia cicadellinicola]AIN47094.1 Lipopolysaccharide biosynthesis protein RffC [Candidatus Baumannia cicadellinicola]